jgi:hypothetical protein
MNIEVLRIAARLLVREWFGATKGGNSYIESWECVAIGLRNKTFFNIWIPVGWAELPLPECADLYVAHSGRHSNLPPHLSTAAMVKFKISTPEELRSIALLLKQQAVLR